VLSICKQKTRHYSVTPLQSMVLLMAILSICPMSIICVHSFKTLKYIIITITHYRQDCVKCKLPVLNLLTGQKSGFHPARVTRCTDSGQTWQGRRAPGSAWLCKISPHSVQEVGMQPQKYEFPLFGKSSSHRGEPFDRFLEFLWAFIRPTILR